MENDGKYVYLNMPKGTTEAIAKKRLYYLTINWQTKKIENVSLDEEEPVLNNMKQEMVFTNLGKRFGIIGIKFEKQKTAQIYALENIKTEVVVFPVISRNASSENSYWCSRLEHKHRIGCRGHNKRNKSRIPSGERG